MNYSESYSALKNLFTSSETNKEYDTIKLHNVAFSSRSFGILPGIEEYKCNTHNVTMEEELSYYSGNGANKNKIHIKDIFVKKDELP